MAGTLVKFGGKAGKREGWLHDDMQALSPDSIAVGFLSAPFPLLQSVQRAVMMIMYCCRYAIAISILNHPMRGRWKWT